MESRKLRQGESRKLRQGESRCRVRCLFNLQRIEGRFVLLCDKSTKNVGASEMPPHPSTSEGGALREPRARQGNGFPAHTLPSTDRQRTPSRCCASHPAYAPTTTSPARYRAGRAKQHNHARNVKPLPPRRSPGRTLPGQEGVKGDTCLSPSPFSLPFGKKRKKKRPSMLRSLNEHRLLPLLSAPPTFLTSPRTCS